MNKQIFVTGAVTESRPYRSDMANLGDVEGVGTLRWVDDKLYRWVQNRDDTALAAGDVVSHLMANAGNMLKWVTACATADFGTTAGVVASTTIDVGTTTPTVDYSDGGYGWIQIKGYCASAAIYLSATTTATAGATMVAGTDNVKAAYPGLSVAMSTAPKYARHLILLETIATATAAASTAKVYINCL